MESVKEIAADTAWELEAHSELKHQILEKYLKAWIPILGMKNPRVIYFDTFAGPGSYSNGKDGSPIVALKTFVRHSHKSTVEMLFYFMESDRRNRAHLEKNLAPWIEKPRANHSIEIIDSTFQSSSTEILDSISEDENLYPSFWFVDPFGYSDVPMSLLGRISKQNKSEVFVHFMTGYIKRFLSAKKNRPEDAYTKVFGDESWKDKGFTGKSDAEEIVDFYREQLLKWTDYKYVWIFGVQAVKSYAWQHLVFATKNLLGLEKMKCAMWDIGNGSFRIGKNQAKEMSQGNGLLISPEIMADTAGTSLQEMLLKEFSGKTVSFSYLKDWTTEHTPYCASKHLSNKALKVLESQGRLTAEFESEPSRKRRAGTFTGTNITFL